MKSASLALLALAWAFWSADARAQTSASASGGVTIMDPPQLAKQSELVLAPVSRPAGLKAVVAEGLAARYEVGGAAGDVFNISVPDTLTLVRSGGTEEVLLTLTPTGALGVLGGERGARGSGQFSVGGVLGVTRDTAAGAYEGAFTVILSLQ